MIDFFLMQVDPVTVQDCASSVISVDSFALNCGAVYSDYVAQNWDINWQDKVGVASPEFIALLNISRYIAGPMLALWLANAMNNLWRNGLNDSWTEIASVLLLVTALYVNDGSFVRQSTLAARSLLNYQNSLILQLANAGENFEAKLYEIADYTMAEQAIVELRGQCNGITNNDDLLVCMQGAEVQAQEILDKFKTADGGQSSWLDSLTNYADQTIGAFLDNPAKLNIAGAITYPFVKTAIEGILASINGVVQNLIELSWLLTAIIAPIPLALSLYPGGRNAALGWVSAFLSVGLLKINLNIATATVIGMLYNRGPADGLADLILLSLGVPVLAFAMSAGGGLAIFSGVSTLVSTVSLGLINLATRS